jgi:hypothetical protein
LREFVKVCFEIDVFGIYFFGIVLVVPQIWASNINLKNLHSLAASLHLEIDEGFTYTSPNFGEVVGKIAQSEEK